MPSHRTASRQEWGAELTELLEREKEQTRRGDELARQRREPPWVRVEKEHTLATESGPRTLLQLFEERTELMVYQFRFGPSYTARCPTCSSTADSFDGVLAHLEACDVTLICVSTAPLEKLSAYRERMGWSFDWASSYASEFSVDYGTSASGQAAGSLSDEPQLLASELAALKLLNDQPAVREHLPLAASQNASESGTDLPGYFSQGHGVSTFAREGDDVYDCYSTYARGTELMMSYYAILDRAPNGRSEGDQPMSWLRRRDEYGGRQG